MNQPDIWTIDVLDLQLPKLKATSTVSIQGVETGFGSSDEQYVLVNGSRIGEICPAEKFYSLPVLDLVMGGPGRGDWLVVSMADCFNNCKDGVSWGQFVRGLSVLLESQPGWRMICEEDCDQNEMSQQELSVETFSEILGEYRATGQPPELAIMVEGRP